MTKTFYYTKYGTHAEKKIKVDINICQTVKDFKRVVASILDIPNSQLFFIGMNDLDLSLKYIREFTIFTYKIIDQSTTEILESIIKDYQERKIFFSDHCKEHNLEINFSDKSYKLFGYFVKLTYGDFTFYFSNKEYAKSAHNLINSVFRRGIIQILDKKKSIIESNVLLDYTNQYFIVVLYPIKFKEIANKISNTYYLDYYSTTVSDAQKLLSEEVHSDLHLLPENFILLDEHGNQFTKSSKKLIHIHGLGHPFYYHINMNSKNIEKRTNFELSDNSSSFQLYPVDIKKKPNNRPKSVESKKNINSHQDPIEKEDKSRNRSRSVQKETKPNVESDLESRLNSESSENEPCRRKRISKKKFIPTIVPYEREKSPPSARRRSKSAQNPKMTKPDQQERKIPIIFVIERKDESRPQKILRQIPIKMKIREVQEYLINDPVINIKIDYEITLKYKFNNRKISLDQDKTIEEVEERIKDSTAVKSIKNFIYVEPAPKRNRKLKQKNSDDDDADKYGIDFSPTKKKIRKRINLKEETNECKYQFQYNKNIKELLLFNDSRLGDNEKLIKNEFKINQNEKIYFYIIDEDGDKKRIQNLNQRMVFYKKKLIYINVPQKIKEMKPKSTKITYYYQTNTDREISNVKLDKDATVLVMKQKIAEVNNIANLANVKIIFAGKELLDDILLEPLKIGDIPLFVYIRLDQDLLLLTAKALKYL